MNSLLNSNLYMCMFISPEILARYVVIVFFTILNLLVTYIILKKFLFKPAMKFMDNRKKMIEDEIEEGKKIKQMADGKFAEAMDRVDNSIHEATAILNDAKVQAQSQSQSIVEAANKESADIISRAEIDSLRMRKIMIEQMRDEVSELSIRIASKIIQNRIDPKSQKDIIEQFIDEETKNRGTT